MKWLRNLDSAGGQCTDWIIERQSVQFPACMAAFSLCSLEFLHNIHQAFKWKDMHSKRVTETRELVTSSTWRIHMRPCEYHINALHLSVILPFVSYKSRFYSLRNSMVYKLRKYDYLPGQNFSVFMESVKMAALQKPTIGNCDKPVHSNLHFCNIFSQVPLLGAFAKQLRLLAFSCLPVLRYRSLMWGTTWRKVSFGFCSEICPGVPVLVKVWHK
jgi:hypothetical protein